jgi:hypothetical protein
MARIFGANRAAGTRIEEQEGKQTIEPGALGFAGYAGLFEKGPVGTLQLVTSRTLFDRIYGGIIPESLAPDAARDYYSLANGAGGLAVVRVTDGDERVATTTLYSRNADALVEFGRIDAKNGGRWGGKQKLFTAVVDDEADISNTTLQVGAANDDDFALNELKGGWVEIDGVSNKRYPITGNTAGGLITVAADQTMRADLIAATADPPTNLRYYVVLENASKQISIQINDGEEKKDEEFSLEVFVDGVTVSKYGNLHTDPLNARYWVNVINNDGSNYEITATDLFSGAHVAASRPANQYLNVASVAANILTATIHSFTIASALGNPTLTLGTTSDTHVAQKITITMGSATAGTAVSDKFGALGAVTLGTLFSPPTAAGGALKNKWVPPFTVTAGAGALAAADVLTIQYKPLPVGNALATYLVYPDKAGEPRDTYRVVSNTHKTITFATNVDLTTITAASADFMVVAPYALGNGADGNASVVDSHYIDTAWDTESSPFNRTRGKNLGLVKYATPGVTSTAVQRAGVAYAEAKNHQYRVEIPANITGDIQALTYVHDTIGRSDYIKVSHPSFGSVPDPDPAAQREGKRKVVSLTGMIHGREARIAADFLGYHKAQAGVDAVLPRLLDTALGDRDLDEELLNPGGVNVIKKVGGNYVLWGDRTPHRDSSFKFAHKREQLSYYEQVFIESFDFLIFGINDADSDADARTSIIEFFRPEFAKRALRGDQLVGGKNPAMILKIDNELNTDAVRSAGNKIAEISLRLADTTERFIIRIGQQGVFEDVGQ